MKPSNSMDGSEDLSQLSRVDQMSQSTKEYTAEILSVEGNKATIKLGDKTKTLMATPNAITDILKHKLPIKGKIKIRKNFRGISQISSFSPITKPVKIPKTQLKEQTPQKSDMKQNYALIQKPDKVKRKVSLKHVLVPSDTKSTLNHIDGVDNFYLSLTKFAPFGLDKEKKKFTVFLMDKNQIIVSNLPIRYDEWVTKINEKIVNIAKSMDGFCFKVSVSDKLIVGLGEATVNEVGMRLHFVHGFPYIPSTSIKGSFRSFILEKYFDFDEKEALQDEGFKAIFGGTSNQDDLDKEDGVSGSVIFYDAFPLEKPTIEPDFMTVHFRDYYEHNGKNPPVDTDQPNPISFLTVKNTSFQICLSLLRNPDFKQTAIEGLDPDCFLESVKELLKQSLAENGLGAKTNVGYGRLISLQKNK